MFEKFFIILCYVYCIFAATSFIEQGQRAELFELTDYKIATFKITIPDNEFSTIQQKAEKNYIYETTIGRAKVNIEMFLVTLKGVNFYKAYPGYDYNKILPELKIDKDGFSQIDTKKILKGFDFNPDHYNLNGVVFMKVLESNPEMNLSNTLYTLSKMKIANSVEVQPFFLYLIEYYQKGIKQMPNIFRRGDDDDRDISDFKVKNATLEVEIDGNKKSFSRVTFKMAGNNSRLYGKPSYNLKIHDDNLYGRSQFKIRGDGSEPTFLRTKLVSDIHDRLGIPSVSSNYIILYVNNVNMGLYLIIDAYKPSWIEKSYGESNTSSLYQCEYLFDFNPAYASSCFNENKDAVENYELSNFLKAVYYAKSTEDLENIFEVDHFLTEMAIDYLLGSWDHVQNPTTGHNFYLYKKKNGKWIYLSYDFDLDFGVPRDGVINAPFEQYIKNLNIFNVLILKNPARFEKILKYVVDKVFNPATLYPHIDKLKSFIKPYVKLDKTPDKNGKYPGRLNSLSPDYYSLEEWDANSEFTRVKTRYSYTYGLKFWVLYRYRFVCQYYQMKCDATYLSESYTYPVNRNVEFITGPPIPSINIVSRKPVTRTTTVTRINTKTNSSAPTSSSMANVKCWAQLVGYECCPQGVKDVYFKDEFGDWGINFAKDTWCGLSSYYEPASDKACWSEKYGFPCCKACKVIEKDKDGSWGFELNHWCGIQSYCKT